MSDSKKLILGSYFSSPLYCIELPEYLKDLNKEELQIWLAENSDYQYEFTFDDPTIK